MALPSGQGIQIRGLSCIMGRLVSAVAGGEVIDEVIVGVLVDAIATTGRQLVVSAKGLAGHVGATIWR